MNARTNIGHRITELRNLRKLSQRELARRCNIALTGWIKQIKIIGGQIMKIKANALKRWVEEELKYADNPERAVVSYRERLFLGGYRELEEKEVKVDAEAIAEALNRHGNESVELGRVQSYHFDNGSKFIWTVEFGVYV